MNNNRFFAMCIPVLVFSTIASATSAEDQAKAEAGKLMPDVKITNVVHLHDKLFKMDCSHKVKGGLSTFIYDAEKKTISNLAPAKKGTY